MDKICINGTRPLYGTVAVSGAKNAALPLLAATLLTPGTHTLHNVPDLRDTRTMLKLLETLGAGESFPQGAAHGLGADPGSPYSRGGLRGAAGNRGQ